MVCATCDESYAGSKSDRPFFKVIRKEGRKAALSQCSIEIKLGSNGLLTNVATIVRIVT